MDTNCGQRFRITQVDPLPETDRTARFLRRLDVYLSRLPSTSARQLFLDRQITGWEHRYASFVATEGASEPGLDKEDPPQAADFLMTIAGLARRRGASRSMIGGAMISTSERRLLDSAMLTLLVAADQRCPAIIGQAHLLYHFSEHRRQSTLDQALAQLKRDAQGLLDAISAVEAAARSALLKDS